MITMLKGNVDPLTCSSIPCNAPGIGKGSSCHFRPCACSLALLLRRGIRGESRGPSHPFGKTGNLREP